MNHLHFEPSANSRWGCSYFLNQVDGVENNDGILIIASTNHVERLDSAVTKRPSRFDRNYHFSLPSESERTLYFEHWRKRLEANDKIDFDSAICEIAAKITDGFSFAYLKELLIQALLAMARANVIDAIENKDVDPIFNAADTPNLIDGQPHIGDKMQSLSKTLDQQEHTTTEPPIPENLQGNLFMQTLQAGVATLRKDIDGSVGEEIET